MAALRVRVFARLRELAGADIAVVSVPTPATVADVRRALATALPAAAPLLPHCWFAVGAEFVADDAIVPANADLACLPPVSGG